MKQLTRWFFLSSIAVAICSLATPLPAAGPVAVKAGTLITISGETIENGIVLIRDGKIVAVGADVEIPVEAKVIDASDKVVMPGFIDPHNPAGMSQANERNTNVPFLSAVDSIDPVLDYFEDCRRSGITTANVMPGNTTMIGGRGAILKTAGSYVDDMLLRRDAGLKLSLQPIGGSRMSHLARLRRELDKAKRAMEEKDEPKAEPSADSPSDGENKPEGSNGVGEGNSNAEGGATQEQSQQPSEEETSEGLAVVQQTLKGEMPVYIYCDQAMDVGHAQRLIEQYGFDAVLVIGRDCYEAASLLAKMDKPVIIDPTLVFWKTDPITREDEQVVIPQHLMDAGVKFVFQTDNSTRQTIGSGFLWYQAATCVKYGLDRNEALRAMTLTPAELLGIDKFVGSIEPGKDADLVILSGDPLAVGTWVEKTLVAGEEVYDRANDQKLKRLLEEPAE